MTTLKVCEMKACVYMWDQCGPDSYTMRLMQECGISLSDVLGRVVSGDVIF